MGKAKAQSTPATELHLRRLSIEEALIRLDHYLNNAFMSGLTRVKIVHGKGTGVLRRAIREELARHPLVNSYRPANYREGGEGVTIVELAPR